MENIIPDDLTSAFAHCARITNAHYENFPVASWLLPGNIRPHVYSIYAFARTADDYADEPGMTQEERLEKLDEWKRMLDTCQKTPDHPVFAALAHTIWTFDLPATLFNDLLSAFRQDVLQSRHQTFADLIAYSKCSANPVGRLILTLFGFRDSRMFAESDALCTALQLTNFWQDIAVDCSRDRIYLPSEDMLRYGVTVSDLRSGEVSDRFRALVRDMIDQTRQLFVEGRTLPDRVTKGLKYELRFTWLGGFRILKKIEDADFDIFQRRPKISKSNGIQLLLRSLRSTENIK